MQLEITFLMTGEMRVRVPDGQDGIDFATAKAKVEQIQRELGAAGAPVVWEGAVEKHVHGPTEGRVSFGSRAHGH